MQVSRTSAPRHVIYYHGHTNPIPLAGIAALPYTHVVLASLIPASVCDLRLVGSSDAFGPGLRQAVRSLRRAGRGVLVSFGGAAVPSSAYEAYARDVGGLVEQLVRWVERFGFDGVDIAFEDSSGFTGAYDGVEFLSALTAGLAARLPEGQGLITHAPQTPHWEPKWWGAPYRRVWERVGPAIAWVHNQFHDNGPWDETAALKVHWYTQIAGATGPGKLVLGALVRPGGGEGYLPPDELAAGVIRPLRRLFGAGFGGVAGWEFAHDQGGEWSRTVGAALTSVDN